MESIGGYFGLELQKGSSIYHETPYVLKSGRAALRCILQNTRPSLVYIPFFTCDSLIEPFLDCSTKFVFYEIDENLEPRQIPDLKKNEYFLYVNYFGLKDAVVERLSGLFGDQFIADCTQAFFSKGNGKSWFFNSCRKFFGVPDGSYLYAPDENELVLPDTRNENYLTNHLVQRFNDHPRPGYADFQENEMRAGQGYQRMSKLTEYLLSNVDYDTVTSRRLSNFRFLHNLFCNANSLELDSVGVVAPICYPLLLRVEIDKSPLYDQGIFIPTFWRDVPERGAPGYLFEKQVTQLLWPLPVDQRYGRVEMERLSDVISKIINKCIQ